MARPRHPSNTRVARVSRKNVRVPNRTDLVSKQVSLRPASGQDLVAKQVSLRPASGRINKK